MHPKPGGLDLSAELIALLAGIDTWRGEHPSPTLTEIEEAVDEQLLQVRQRIVEAQIRAHPMADVADAKERRVCPGCGGVMTAKGPKRKTLTTKQGGAIDLERSYFACRHCGAGLFPPGPGVGTPAGTMDTAGTGSHRVDGDDESL